MDYRRFGDTLVIRMDKGEEIIQSLRLAAEKEQVRLAAVEALGAVNDFTVGVFSGSLTPRKSNTTPTTSLALLKSFPSPAL